MIDFLMRSLMFLPGHNEKLMGSAARSEADVLLLDIEEEGRSLPPRPEQHAQAACTHLYPEKPLAQRLDVRGELALEGVDGSFAHRQIGEAAVDEGAPLI